MFFFLKNSFFLNLTGLPTHKSQFLLSQLSYHSKSELPLFPPLMAHVNTNVNARISNPKVVGGLNKWRCIINVFLGKAQYNRVFVDTFIIES